jgi:uncharacterized protein
MNTVAIAGALGERKYRIFRLVSKSDAASVILKLTGEICNLDCGYCYEKRKPYDGNRILRASNVDAFISSLPNPQLAIELHGGEPLLYPKEEFSALSGVLNKIGERVVRLTLQTNATLLDRETLRFLVDLFPRLQIGISCDGPEHLNEFRVDHRGCNSADAITKGLAACAAEKIDVGVICVVTKRSLGHAAAILQHFAQHSIVKVVKFVPCFDINVAQAHGPRRRPEIRIMLEQAAHRPLPWAITPADYTGFLQEALHAWSTEIGPDRYLLEPMVSALRAMHGLTSSNCHFGANKCSHVYTLYPDGEIGSCDELDRRSATYGHLNDTEPLDEARREWGAEAPEDVRRLLTMCEDCDIAAQCGGGCLATRRRLIAIGDTESYCQHRRALLETTRELLVGCGA